MLTERTLETKVGSDYKPPKTKKGGLSLRCASCGTTVDLAIWQPVVRCPNCEKLVYPDRSVRNLLPLGWDCLECGTFNDGLTNFCTFCGAGLASRCLACEAPVTGPICLRCGEHQAHLRHLRQRGVARATWVPIQRERIQNQLDRANERERKEQEAQAAAAVDPTPPPPMSKYERRRQEKLRRRQQRRGRSGWGWPFRGGWIWIVFGSIWLLSRTGFSFNSLFQSPAGRGVAPLPAQASGGALFAQDWWSALLPALNRIPSLTPQDPEYVVVFAVILLGIAGLPLLFFLVDRMVKRLVP